MPLNFSEICLETSNKTLAQLKGLVVEGCPAPFLLTARAAFPELLRTVAGALPPLVGGLPLKEQAAKLACLETDDPTARHPWVWFSATEKPARALDPVRQVHEWGAFLREDVAEVIVWFEHGLWGYRYESFQDLPGALDRLADLLSERCLWLAFGNEESRRSLLHKGQFYWTHPTTGEHVPVDNFVFVTATGDELTLAGVGGRAVLSVRPQGAEATPTWEEDYAEGLREMATYLDGTRPLTPAGAVGTPRQGQFVVKSIYADHDVLAAPELCFCTALGQQVTLESASDTWTVRYEAPAPAGNAVCPEFKGSPPAALRHLAALLAGDFAYTEPLLT